jgi:hypothetical protein
MIDIVLILLGIQLHITEPVRITPLQEQQLYLYEAVDYNYKEYKLFDRLIFLESSWDQSAIGKNYINNKVWSEDIGLLQINNFTWDKKAKELNLDYKNSWKDNILMGMYIYEVQGLNAWKASLKKL